MAKSSKGKSKKKRHIVSNCILLIALIVLCDAGYKWIKVQLEYKKGKDEYADLVDLALKKPADGGDDSAADGSPEAAGQRAAGYVVDWNSLRAINPDIAAWIRFDEPSVIDYPVVHTTDNTTYLEVSFGDNYINAGTIFINADNKPDFSDKNTFIYGHHMNNGTMFAGLMNYEDQSFYQQYPYFYIYTPDNKVTTYHIFAAEVAYIYSDNASKSSYADDKDFQNYLDQVKSNEIYTTDVGVSSSDKIVSLYTCTNLDDSERLLVHGVKADQRECGAQ